MIFLCVLMRDRGSGLIGGVLSGFRKKEIVVVFMSMGSLDVCLISAVNLLKTGARVFQKCLTAE